MTKSTIPSYYIENKEAYILGFFDFMSDQVDDEFTKQEVKQLFKEYMFNYKNIKVDLRFKFWLDIIDESMRR